MHAPVRLPRTRRLPLGISPDRAWAGVLAGVVLAVATACGGASGDGKTSASAAGGKSKAVASACTRLDSTSAYVAYREYIKATMPTPQRFLSAAGTDSAAPEDGFRAMQDKGPTYFYSGDPAAQKKIREKLASVGPYASLLIVLRGTTTASNGDTVTMHLGGHYVGGELEGKAATSRVVTVVCRDSLWKLGSIAEEPSK